ncbi:MAG: 4Fe-4S dicluster domain-containing protein [Armatimonadetes bacterium]|nr:4Fe-4S dicluster domain-containing protein [Armatimonadota bacterium]MDW8122387.1 4Fe-4S dicluster domain-containing protein [Armatimonadota bacterium]
MERKAEGTQRKETRWVSTTDLQKILENWAEKGVLVAPTKVNGEVLFQRIRDIREICWDEDYVNSLVPPKEFVLPNEERLLSYRRTDDQNWVVEVCSEENQETILFGVRSCDVAGLAYLDRFLLGEMFSRPDLADPQYKAKREKFILISIVCQKAAPTCMCVCCDGGPALTEGFDWQLTRLTDGWLVEIGSEKGEKLATGFHYLLQPATDEAIKEQKERVATIIRTFDQYSPDERVPTMAAGRMVSRPLLKEEFWSRIGSRCVECGGCAFICPTCFCFNVVDRPLSPSLQEGDANELAFCPLLVGFNGKGADYERVRYRDCCMLQGFVRQAGGIYPRRTTGERCKTRFFHKLSWQFLGRMNRLGCTGCGRCLRTCLGEVGISRVATEMTEALAEKKLAPAGVTAPKREHQRGHPK